MHHKKNKFWNGLGLFIIFFGIAVVEAFRGFNVYGIFFWIAIGILFLLADNMKNIKANQS